MVTILRKITLHSVILSVAKNLSRMRVFMVPRTSLEILRRGLLRMTIIISLFALPPPAYAQSPSPGVNIGEKFGFGGITSLGEATSKLVMPIFSVITAMVIIYFLWGAFNYLQSKGDKEEIEHARQMIIHAIIGFIILMLAFMILQFLLSSLFGVTGFQIIQTQ